MSPNTRDQQGSPPGTGNLAPSVRGAITRLWRTVSPSITRVVGGIRSTLGGGSHAHPFSEALLPAGLDAEPAVEDAYPLSPLQEGMLFESLHSPHSTVNVEQLLCRVRETVDVPAFMNSWCRLAARHPLLRTSFRRDDTGQCLQEVHRRVLIPWRAYDWRGLSRRERRRRWENFLKDDRRRGFDPSAAPLFRVALIREKEDRYRFCWTSHHLLGDGRSLLILLDELFRTYDALRSGAEPDLPAPALFRPYIDWLGRQDWQRSEAFWRDQLRDFRRPTPLPAARERARDLPPEECVGEQEDRLSPETTTALRSWADANRLTLNTVFQGAWALLLSRYAAEPDLVFGAIRACRRSTVATTDRVAGPCINNVPMRVRVDHGRPLLDWLHELQAQWIALRKHEHTPLAKVHGWSGVPRGTPLFETLVNFQEPAWDDVLRAQGGGWSRRQFALHCQPGLPLAVDGYAGPALRLKMTYDRRRFEPASVVRLLGGLRTLLEAMPARSGQALDTLPVVSVEERSRLLVEWNATRTEYPRHRRVHELFEAQARRTPRAVALEFGAEQVTYGELNGRANRIAHHLRGRGVGRGTTVALCVGRSAAMVVGMLGILKAGGAYVPLDPDYPAERLAFMLDDVGAPFLVTQECCRGRVPGSQAEVVCLDGPTASLAGESDADLREDGQTDDPAYVIYTSGSTGTPKGTAVPHRAVVRLVVNTDYIRLGPDDRVAQASNSSFDAATFEVWGALLSGARLVGVTRDELLSPHVLAARIEESNISTLFLTTALFNRLTLESPGLFAPLRTLLFGGEQADPARVRDVVRRGKPGRLLHVYGPTETTTFATWHHVRDVDDDATTVPIGRPISNTSVYVLDGYGHPVPVGVPGELYVGGDGVALGYVNRPELTAERFLPDPFDPSPGARMYRTGDVVRYLPDGELVFLGRTDRQVKVRGFRVELGEVEAALARHPDVREAVVVAREDAPGQRRLVAYLTPRAGLGRPIHHPREFLRRTLPDYMVPSATVQLERLPLTPGGKVDRAALPQPIGSREGSGPAAEPESFTAPRTPTEEVTAGVWADLLNLDQAGIHDHFFERGGDSLVAMQAVARLSQALGVELPVRALFEYPTVAALSAHADACRRANQSPYAEMVPAPRENPLPASVEQERVWAGYQAGGPQSRAFVWPMQFHLKGPLQVEALGRSLAELVRRHEVLRTTFRTSDGGLTQVVGPARPVLGPVVSLEGRCDVNAEVLRLSLDEAGRPFDLSGGSPLRASLIRLGEEEHRLLLTLHHIVYDLRTLELLARELSDLYGCYCRGEPSPLAEPTLHYGDYAAWQRRWLRPGEPAYEGQVAYWRGKLAAPPEPWDECFLRGADGPPAARRVLIRKLLCPRLFDRVRGLARREGVTLFMAGLAALKAAIHRITGQGDILICAQSAKRSRPGTEGLVGYLGNHLALRTDLSDDPTYSALLHRVRQTVLEAAAHDELPYEVLARSLQEAGQPLPPLHLMYEGVAPSQLKLIFPGLRTQFVRVKGRFRPTGLGLLVSARSKRPRLVVKYDTERYDADAVRSLIELWADSLRQVVDTPGHRLSLRGRGG